MGRLIFLISSVFVGLVAVVAIQAVLSPPALPNPPLKELAKQKNIDLGNYAALKRINEPAYADILAKQFAFVTVDGEPNWQFNDGAFRPMPDQFDYSRIDQVVGFAKDHKMPIRIQHLVWGEEKWLPEWLKNGSYNKPQLLDLIEKHIKTVGAHYQGDVRDWSVVNEAFTRGQHQNGLNDWWGDATGDQDYIDQAFIWARQADPDATLILNDFGNESQNSVSDAMYSYIKGARSRGVPIDAIGMQMHIGGDKPPSKEAVIANMRRFAGLGVKVFVTEFDVTMNDFAGTEQQKNDRQAEIYYSMIRACIESKVCSSFSLLGITDKESWYNELGTPNSDPLPFDDNYQPKPAYWYLRQALVD